MYRFSAFRLKALSKPSMHVHVPFKLITAWVSTFENMNVFFIQWWETPF